MSSIALPRARARRKKIKPPCSKGQAFWLLWDFLLLGWVTVTMLHHPNAAGPFFMAMWSLDIHGIWENIKKGNGRVMHPHAGKVSALWIMGLLVSICT